jgi:hypothetical protein
MSEPWTPGPWTIEIDELEVDTPAYYLDVGPASIWLGQNREPSDQIEADARLIAAAPETAELLDELAQIEFEQGRPRALILEVRALLSRIRGEA